MNIKRTKGKWEAHAGKSTISLPELRAQVRNGRPDAGGAKASRARSAAALLDRLPRLPSHRYSPRLGVDRPQRARVALRRLSLAKLFFSYSHVDEGMRDQLEVQLSMLKRQGIIETWHDRRIGAGQEIDASISRNLEDADIILLLVSPNFLASDYCYDREMLRAMSRHGAGEAIVIPIILRACDWHPAPFGKLNATPPDGRPISQAVDQDQAFLEVAKAIREAVKRLPSKMQPAASATGSASPAPALPEEEAASGILGLVDVPRSSNLRVAKRFTDQDKDAFKLDTFEYMARFFAASLEELSARNPGTEGRFRRVDGNRFTAVVYVEGKAVARCTVFMGGARGFLDGIAYSTHETTDSNSFNETVSVDHDEQALFLRSMGMSFHNREREQKLTQEGAAELYWSMFIAPLQRQP